MAVLKDLIVHGPSRFLSAAYYNKIEASEISSTTGSITTLGTDLLNAKEAVIQKGLATNFKVSGELETSAWTNSNIAQVEGNFYLSPTTKSNCTIKITGSKGNWTIEASSGTFSTTIPVWDDSTSTSTTIGWLTKSKVLVTGSITINGVDYPLGTCKGLLSGPVTATGFVVNTVTSKGLDNIYDALGSIPSSNLTGKDIQISLYELSNNGSTTEADYKPVGIFLTAYGKDKQTYIDIYGGTNKKSTGYTGSTNQTGMARPNVRIGHLVGLPAITVGEKSITPTGWGIYTDNGYFRGTVFAKDGVIATWNIGSTSIYSGTNSMTSTTQGTYIGTGTDATSGIRNYKDANTFVNISQGVITAKAVDLTGKITATSGSIAGWRIESTYLASGSATSPAANVLLLSPSGTSSSYTVAGQAKTGWVITAGTTFGVNKDGGIYATSGKIGGFDIGTTYLRNGNITSATNTSVAGVYLGTDGLNISNGTAATTSYITKTAVNIGNKLTWNGTTLTIDGSASIGGTTASTVVSNATAGATAKTNLDSLEGDLALYTPLEYLQSSGTQRIDTGIKRTAYPFRIETQVTYVNSISGEIDYAGDYGEYGSGIVNGIYSSSQLYQWGGSAWYPGNIAVSLNTQYSVCMEYPSANSRQAIINGVEYLNNITNSMPTPGSYNIGLFSGAGNRQYCAGSIRLTYARIYIGGILVRDYIPVKRKSDNVLGMYDLLNNVFYTNAGTGTFTAGPEVSLLDKQNLINAQATVYDSVITSRASTYITSIDSNQGITIKPINTTGNDYLQINSTSIDFYRGIGTNSAAVSVMSLSDSVFRMGKSNAQRVEITASAVDMYDKNNKLTTRVNENGLTIYKAGTQVASYGTDATIGQVAANLYNVLIDADGGIALRKNTTSLLTINSSQIDINNSSGNVMTRVDSSGLTVYDGNGTDDANKIAIFGSTVRVGKKAAGYTTIASTGMDIYAGSSNTLLAHIGYTNDGVPEGGGSQHVSAAYYSFGSRASGSDIGAGSFSAGGNNTASGYFSHAEGKGAQATGDCAHAEGYYPVAAGHYSHASGKETVADQDAQTAVGKYNTKNNTNNLFVVGIGTSDSARKNGFGVASTGKVTIDDKPLIKVVTNISLNSTQLLADGYTANNLSKDVSSSIPSGYTMVAVIPRTTGGNSVVMYYCEASGTTVYYRLRNYGAAVTVTPAVQLICVKSEIL